MKVVQCSLRSGTTSLVAWIDSRPDLRAGVSVTLKDSEDPSRLWKVVSVGKKILEKGEMKRSNVFDSIRPKTA